MSLPLFNERQSRSLRRNRIVALVGLAGNGFASNRLIAGARSGAALSCAQRRIDEHASLALSRQAFPSWAQGIGCAGIADTRNSVSSP
jgi:hypothetical protein